MQRMLTDNAATPGRASLRFRLVTAQSELFAIAPEWNRLVQESASPEAMMDPSWLLLWWRHYGAGVELAVGLLYEGDELVGLAPLCIRQYVYRFGLVFRRLQFLGVDANEKDGVCSEYIDFIAASGYEHVVARTFVQLIADGHFGKWHELVLSGLKSDDGMAGLLEAELARVGLTGARRATTCAYLKLPKTWDSYLKSLGAKKRHNIKYALAKFEEWVGERGWALERASSPSSFETGFDVLVALHEERWRADGRDGVFSSPRFTAFHREYITTMAASGQVDLCWLTVGGDPVAAIYTIRAGNKVRVYQYGRALGMPPRVRVGLVISALMIKQAIERGDVEFDFLGGESRYKLNFATDLREVVQIRAARPTAREYIRLGLVNARDKFAAAMRASEALRQPKPLPGPANNVHGHA